MSSLEDKLRSLGVKIGTGDLRPVQVARKGHPIEETVPGYDFMTPNGTVYVVEKSYPLDYLHGNTQLSPSIDLGVLGDWAKISLEQRLNIPSFCFLDTETSGLAGGTGTFAFLVGLGGFTPNGFKLTQLFMRDPADESALLTALTHFLAPYKVVVTYNGKSFDIPLLTTRHILNGFSSPFPQLGHIDLLHMSRKIWKNRLTSRRLGDLETDLLQITRTEEEVPGWIIPDLYFEYLRTGDASRMAGVIYHNGMDIVSLAALFAFTSNFLAHPAANPESESLDLIAVARLYDELGRIDEAIELYEIALEKGLPLPFYFNALQRYASIFTRQGRFEEAARLWEKAAVLTDPVSCVELAKHFEHRIKDIGQAIFWTRTAILYPSSIPKVDLIHRLERLEKKLEQKRS